MASAEAEPQIQAQTQVQAQAEALAPPQPQTQSQQPQSEKLPKLSPSDYKIFNRIAVQMDYFVGLEHKSSRSYADEFAA